MRILSLLPSATEIICALGLREHLVGVTHECDFPPGVADLPKITRSLIPSTATSAQIDQLVRDQLQTTPALYALDAQLLAQLRPDLIVTQSLCGVCAVADDEVRRACQSLAHTPQLVNLEPQCLDDLYIAIQQVAAATDTRATARQLVAGLQQRVRNVIDRVAAADLPRPRVALLEWLDPPFSAGHWNPELIRLAGGCDGLGKEQAPSRSLTWPAVIACQPEVVLIACCGYTIERTLADLPLLAQVTGWQDLPAVRAGRVLIVDGSQYFNRPGPRLIDSLEIAAYAINPAAHPRPPAPLVTARACR